MGYTTYCNPYDLERGDGHVLAEGVEIDGEVKAKVVEAEKKPAPKKATATTKVVKKS
jgi:hypothetical protein